MIAIAALTIVEISRRRFALMALLGTVAVAALTGWGLHALHAGGGEHHRSMTPLEARAAGAMVLPLIAYLFSFVLAFAATMLAATMLTAEVESGVLLPVLSRPLSRASVVIGKAMGLAVVLIAYAGISGLVEFAVVDATMGFIPPHPFTAVAALAGVALVMMAFTLVLGARLQTIASGIVSVLCFGVGWMVGIAASIGSAFHNEALLHAGTIAQLLLPADALWRVAVYQLEPTATVAQLAANNGGWAGPFFVITPPPPAMVIWSVLWIAAMLAIAAKSFSTRDV